nr:hypothetical protein [uncultured Lachnoanaerobaculum sp.]
MSSDGNLKVSRIVKFSVIPLVFVISAILVKFEIVGVEISGVFVVLILIEGGAVGALIALAPDKLNRWVWICEAVWVVLQLVILGKLATNIELELKLVVIISEAFLIFGSYLLVKVIKIYPKSVKFMFTAFALWSLLTVATENNLLDSFVVTMLIDIVFNNIYQYYAECNEIYYLHKLGESEFNKEYFDLYFNRNNLFFRVGYYLACISSITYIKRLRNLIAPFLQGKNKYIYTMSLNELQNLRDTLRYTFLQYKVSKLISSIILNFGCTCFIFIFLVLIIIPLAYHFILPKTIRRYLANAEKLVATKEKNFASYTASEKAIILE